MEITIVITKFYTAWYKNGELHREDGPAIFHSVGTEEWYFNGLRHREDMPAFTNPLTGDRVWYEYGKIIRKEKYR